MPAERLQKIIAAAGIASRRHAEEIIQQGRVSVNGQIVSELGVYNNQQKTRTQEISAVLNDLGI